MQNFLVAFKSLWELQDFWEVKCAGGVAFFPTPHSFTVNSQINLVLRIDPEKVGAVIPVRIIQILKGTSPASSGIVVEFVQFSLYRDELDALIRNPDVRNWRGLQDFNRFLKANPKAMVAANLTLARVQKYLRNSRKGNYYDALGIKTSASTQQIREAYRKFAAEFHPDSCKEELSEESIILFEKAYKQISQAYDILRDPKKRTQYDFSSRIVVRRQNESVADFKIRQIQFKMRKERDQNKEAVGKAERIAKEALAAEEKGDLQAAIKSLRIALIHDPANGLYRRRLRQLENQVPKSVPCGQRKLEELLLGKAESSKEIHWIG